MRRSPLACVGVLAVLAAGAAHAQAPAVFDRLHGEWVGDGTLFNRSARFTMTWRQRDGFATLIFSNAFVDSTGAVTPVLRAAAIYRATADPADGVWLDSRGVRVELAWEASDTALVVRWTAPTESGRTTYRLVSDQTVEVRDEVRTGEGWRLFATATYRRE